MILREEFLFVTLIHISITGADSPSSGTLYFLVFHQCKGWVNETARGRSQKGCWFRGQRGPVGLPAPPYLTTLWLSRPTCLKWMRATWRLQLGMKPHSLQANSLFVKCQSHWIIRENTQWLVTSQHKSKLKMSSTQLWIWKMKDLDPHVSSLQNCLQLPGWVPKARIWGRRLRLGYKWSHENCTICSQIPSLPNQR